jgi:hypothetical protein
MLAEGEATAEGFATLGLVAAALIATVVLVTSSVETLIAYRTPSYDPALLRTLWDLVFVKGAFLAFPIGLYLLGYGVAILRTGALARWLGAAALLAMLLQALGVIALSRHGFLAPDGAGPIIATLAFVAWNLLAAISLLTRPAGAPTIGGVASPGAA